MYRWHISFGNSSGANFPKRFDRINPTLSLEQVYGAITFYLGAQEEVEEDITERERVEDEFTKTHPAPPHLKETLECVRQQLLA